MKNWCLLIGLLFLTDVVSAQKIEKVIGPSPEATAFSKYGNIPVTTYTGIPNIEIPLYKVQNNDIEMPITLSYHAGGFRVDEEASRTGLGWVLNAGGVITRSVNGEDDFLPVKGYLNNPIPEFFDSQVTAVLRSSNNLIGNTSSNPNTYVANVAGNNIDLTSFLPYPNNPDASTYDFEPDVFTYNFNGISGKFTIKKNKEIVKQSPDATEIKLLNNNGTSWQITTSDGIKYIFDMIEKCKFQSYPGNYSYYITAWYLTKIISPNGAEVSLSYSEGSPNSNISYNNINEKYILEVIPLNSAAMNSGLKPSSGTKTTTNPPVKSYNPIFLESIIFPNGSLELEYEDRIDMIGDKRLSKLKINNLYDITASFYYEFVQDYFTATYISNTIPTDPSLDQNIFNKRLKLTSLKKLNIFNTVNQIHEFSYDEENLPSKKSFSRDDWGFYNGAQNSTFLPKTLFISRLIPNLMLSYSSGANRSASSTHVKAYILKEIKYPTGGKTTFNFESNDYNLSNSINGGNIPSSVLIDTAINLITRRGFDDTFNVRFPTTMTSSLIKFRISSQNGQNQTYPYPMWDDAYFEIYSANDLNTPIIHTSLGYQEFWVNLGENRYKREDQFTLPAGDYIIKTHFASNVLFLNYIDISFNFQFRKDLTSTPNQMAVGGGVRVAKITNTDQLGNVVLDRNYSYNYNFDYNGDGIAEKCSYGKRLAFTSYTSYEKYEMCAYSPHNGSQQIGISQSYNLYSQSSIPNNEVIIGYDKVLVWDGINKFNGYTEYDYSNNASIQTSYSKDGFDSRPAGIPNLISLNNGYLLKQTEYVFKNNSFKKLKEVINNYSSTPVITHVGAKAVPTTFSGCNGVAQGHGLLFAQYPAFQSFWNRLSSQIVNDYSDDTNYISTKTEYQYENDDSPKNYLPRVTSVIQSDEKKTMKVEVYPTDYADGTPFIDDLKISNIISSPIEKVVYNLENDSIKILSGEIIRYKAGGKGLVDKTFGLETIKPIVLSSFKFSNNLLGEGNAITSFQACVPDTGYLEKATYEYDLKGNIKMVSIKDAPQLSYLWGYSNQYPIAEVKNASSEEMYYDGFEDRAAGFSGGARTGDKCLSDPGGTTVSKVMPAGKEYVISYWYKSETGEWQFSGELPYVNNTHTMAGGPFFDDVRIHPKDAQMTTYTYKPLVGMTSMTDASGRTTHYEYDGFQRLKNVKDHEGNIIKGNAYHYRASN